MKIVKTTALTTSLNRGNPILEYWGQMERQEIIVPQKIYKLYKKLSNDIVNPRDPWIYDDARAWHIIDFVEKYCKHSKGKWGGKPIRLELWQKALLAAAFGFIDKHTRKRKYKVVFLSTARKNGKSTLSAGVGLYLMVADGEPGAEVYAVATKEEQAKIIWNDAKRMVNKSPALKKRIKTLVKALNGLGRYEDSSFKPLGSDSNSLDGLNVHGACLDELHAWKDKNLYDVIFDATSAREQPMIFVTTTAGFVRECVYDEMYDYASKLLDGIEGFEDETFLPVIYELDSRDEWTDPKCWVKPNPGLGTIKKESALAEKVEKAKLVPSDVSNLLTKDFNLVDAGAGDWLPYEAINNTETYDINDLRDSYAIGGCDLSSTTDLTCATLLVMQPGSGKKYVIQQYFLPGELLEQRVIEDKIPYDKWRDRGLLTACDGYRVNYSDVTQWFLKMLTEYDIRPLWIYYDRALAGYWVKEMESYGFEMVKCAQGALTFNQPMRNLEADLRAKNVNYNNNPILKWCMTNVTVKRDENDMMRPVKGTSTRKRIDGLVSLLDAYVGLYEHMADYLNII